MGAEISTHLAATKTSIVCKSPCLLNLPPTNLEWSVCFFHLSLLSGFGPQFMNQHQGWILWMKRLLSSAMQEFGEFRKQLVGAKAEADMWKACLRGGGENCLAAVQGSYW